jgi:hypothetical protein
MLSLIKPNFELINGIGLNILFGEAAFHVGFSEVS